MQEKEYRYDGKKEAKANVKPHVWAGTYAYTWAWRSEVYLGLYSLGADHLILF